MSGNIAPNIVNNGLVLCLDAANTKSYVSGSTTWMDLSRSGINGTLTNGPIFSSTNGGSIMFDGVDDYVSTNYNTALNNFTVCVWFRVPDSTNAAARRILDKNYITGFWLGKNTSGAANSWGGGVLESSPPYGRYLTLTDSQWHFLTSIRSGTTHTLYGDGITNTTSGTVSSTALNTENLFIGIENGGSLQQLKGNIAQILIYNRDLSITEVLQNYNATKARYI
jgi:hypothetical protein